MDTETHYSPRTALTLVVASMVGTGVFTSLGFQLEEIQSGFALLLLWVVGGVVALAGAVSYGELGSVLPRSGGEYNFLGQIYHPVAGFVSGCISTIMGFAAPSALVAITFGTYIANAFPSQSPTLWAVGLVIALTGVHTTTRRAGARVQRSTTFLKIGLIVSFCLVAWFWAPVVQPINFSPSLDQLPLITSGAFAVALIYVYYAYTGWNIVTYMIDEFEEPGKMLSRVMSNGTFVVLCLYLLLNFTFLVTTPIDLMVGRVEIGYVSAYHVFGHNGAMLMAIMLALLLISTLSALTLAGPRVFQVLGQDFTTLRAFAKTNQAGVPYVAVLFQSALALLFILTASFDFILVFAGFALGLNSFIAVLGVFVLRWRKQAPGPDYQIPFYPLPPLLFLALMGWTLIHIMRLRPEEALASMAVIVIATILYTVLREKPSNRS
ncbi:MAG: amino acid permease [Pseudomonadales bacterium]